MNLDEVKEVFIAEASEILQKMESSLLFLENNPATDEMVNDLFRSIHTIKGSASIFGYEHIVEFTHVAENLLDKVRDQLISLTPALVEVLLDCRDHISDLIEYTANNRIIDAEIKSNQTALLKTLNQVLVSGGIVEIEKPETIPPISIPTIQEKAEEPEPVKKQREPERPVQVEKISISQPAEVSRTKIRNWHISLRFKRDTFRDGLEPYSVLKYLNKDGQIINLITITSFIPAFDELSPEDCFLGFEIEYKSDKDINFILQAFEFVEYDCLIQILPPDRDLNDIYEFFQRIPDRKLKIARILIFMDVVTREEIKAIIHNRRVTKNKNNSIEKNPIIEKETPLPVEKTVHAVVEEKSIEKEDVLESANAEASAPPAPVQAEIQKETLPSESSQSKAAVFNRESKIIRIDSTKLDSLINLVGELVIAGANINQISFTKNDSEMIEAGYFINHLISEIRDTALRLRMVQIGETFSRFNRTVRDIGHELNKEIKLTITGAETELDKTVVEKITDPLMHLIRNAIDHGIESKEDRIKKNKSPQGQLFLNAYHETGSIVIEVKDDGKGLDKNRILKKAIEKNLVSSDRNQLSDQEVYQFIFKPGFSTAEKVTNISGRGVGLDVVERNIDALRGSITVISEVDRGTTFKVRLPLTLAIIDGFHFKVGHSFYVIPLELVVECIEYRQDLVDEGSNRNFINLRGNVLPFLRLHKLFNQEEYISLRKNILVIQYAGRQAGLLVDSLNGEVQTVIKPLGKMFEHLKGISGSTILGNGEVALILDIHSLFKKAEELEKIYKHV